MALTNYVSRNVPGTDRTPSFHLGKRLFQLARDETDDMDSLTGTRGRGLQVLFLEQIDVIVRDDAEVLAIIATAAPRHVDLPRYRQGWENGSQAAPDIAARRHTVELCVVQMNGSPGITLADRMEGYCLLSIHTVS